MPRKIERSDRWLMRPAYLDACAILNMDTRNSSTQERRIKSGESNLKQETLELLWARATRIKKQTICSRAHKASRFCQESLWQSKASRFPSGKSNQLRTFGQHVQGQQILHQARTCVWILSHRQIRRNPALTYTHCKRDQKAKPIALSQKKILRCIKGIGSRADWDEREKSELKRRTIPATQSNVRKLTGTKINLIAGTETTIY
jgi:hypothetical protein